MSDESIELLRKELESFDKDKLRHLLEQLGVQKEPRPRKTSPQNGPVKVFTSVNKHYECLLCGSKFTRTHKFEKGEVTSTVDKKGDIHTVRLTGKAGEVDIPATTNKCSYCCQAIMSWTREELERRFMLLADACSYKEICNYNVAISKEA